MSHLIPLIGISGILLTAFLLSKNRKAIKFRIVGWGLGLQLLLALFVMKTKLGFDIIQGVSGAAVWFLNFAFEGTKFVFGPILGDPHGSQGFVFAFTALPLIIYVAAFFALLYYLRILPLMVLGAGKIMFRLFGTSGAESLEVAASVIMGQTEAPLVIRPFVAVVPSNVTIGANPEVADAFWVPMSAFGLSLPISAAGAERRLGKGAPIRPRWPGQVGSQPAAIAAPPPCFGVP